MAEDSKEYSNEQKTALFNIEDQDKFLIQSEVAVQRIFTEIARDRDIVTGYFNNGTQHILTAVLGVLPDHDRLVLDYSQDEKINQQVLEYGRLVCTTRHDRIRIKFSCEGIQLAKYQDRKALSCPIPEFLYRLQRREFFRVDMPVAHPIICRIPQAGGDPLELPVMDMSVGGLRLQIENQEFNPELKELLTGCGIKLPELGFIAIDLEVRNIMDRTLVDGRQARHIGCAFAGLGMEKNVTIQRFLHQVQVEQKAKAVSNNRS
ncbi:flagellar brake protein [Candidatus Pacearchaeota archaeon]|nr:flagellar brake protein [Candidatus Pacearchaeota archaeon]